MFWLKFRRFAGNSGTHPAREQVITWGVQEVCTWLENLQLGEYADKFVSHDIRGRELLTLARRDLKELGISKVGHVKRILQAINDLNNWVWRRTSYTGERNFNVELMCCPRANMYSWVSFQMKEIRNSKLWVGGERKREGEHHSELNIR